MTTTTLFSLALAPRLHSLHGTLVQIPVEPAARVLAHTSPPGVLRQSRGRPGAHAGLAVEEQGGVLGRARVAVQVLKVLVGDVEALDGRGDGDVDCAGDFARVEELVGFADVFIRFVSFNTTYGEKREEKRGAELGLGYDRRCNVM